MQSLKAQYYPLLAISWLLFDVSRPSMSRVCLGSFVSFLIIGSAILSPHHMCTTAQLRNMSWPTWLFSDHRWPPALRRECVTKGIGRKSLKPASKRISGRSPPERRKVKCHRKKICNGLSNLVNLDETSIGDSRVSFDIKINTSGIASEYLYWTPGS